MTEAVSSVPSNRFAIRRLLDVSPTMAHTIRFGVATAAAIWIGKAPGLIENNSTWILITVLVVFQPTVGGARMKGLLRIAGTVAAVPVSIVLFGCFAQDPPLLMAGLFAVQVIAAYGYTGPRFQYAWFVWAFTTATILGGAMTGLGAVETLAFQRGSMICIGVLLVMVVDSLLWPARAQPQLQKSLSRRARQLSQALRRIISDPGSAANDEKPTGPDPDSLANQLALVDGVRSELGGSGATADAFAHLALLLETLQSRARILAAPIETPAGNAGGAAEFSAAQAELAERVGSAIDELADAVSESRAPNDMIESLERALQDVEAALTGWDGRASGRAAIEGRVADLRDLVAVLRAAQRTLSEAAEPDRVAPIRTWMRWRPDPFRMKIALRTGSAVIAAFLVPAALGWPTNTLVAPVSFMLSALTRGAAVQTLVSLAVVVALGWLVADVSIVYLAPHLGQAPLAMLAPFSLAVAFAHIAASRPHLAMLPSMGGLVALLSAFGGTGAPTDVYGAYSTVCYMAMGIGVGWLFGRLMWPATAAGLFRDRVSAQLGLCLESVRAQRQSSASERPRLIADLIRGVANHSAQLGRLHVQATHEPVERALDPTRRAQILALIADLVDTIVGIRGEMIERLLEVKGARWQPLLDALKHEDASLIDSMQIAAEALKGESRQRATLDEARRGVEARLHDLDAEPGALIELDETERRQFLIELDARRRLVTRQCEIEDWLADWRIAEGAEHQRLHPMQ